MNTLSTQVLSSGGLAVRASNKEDNGIVESLYRTAARLDRFGIAMLRLGLVVVLCFLGGLKTANAIPAAAQTTTAPVPTGSAELPHHNQCSG